MSFALRASLLSLAVALSADNFSLGLTGPPVKPNLIFMLGDEVGWNNVGWHSTVARTPQLDLLAKSGVILNQHCETVSRPLPSAPLDC